MRNIADEIILVPTGDSALEFNGLISLNKVAAFIWSHLEQVEETETLVQMVLEEFEVDEETARKDVEGLCRELRMIGFIE